MPTTLPTLREMLQNGVHFGHVKSKWNPKMKPYIFTTRDNVHVINLERTREKLEEAINFLTRVVERGGKVLFVGTKRQAKDIVKTAAEQSNMPYICERWFGGTLTNFPILRSNIKTLEDIETAEEKGRFDHLTKKERLRIEEKKRKLQSTLEGLRSMDRLPEALFVVDSVHESIAVTEAHNLHIPVVALADTNANPTHVDYPIPANDDAAKSLSLLLNTITKSISDARDLALATHAQAIELENVEEKSEDAHLSEGKIVLDQKKKQKSPAKSKD